MVFFVVVQGWVITDQGVIGVECNQIKKRFATLFSILDSFTIWGYFRKQVRFYKVF